jgi:hypothetical protein
MSDVQYKVAPIHFQLLLTVTPSNVVHNCQLTMPNGRVIDVPVVFVEFARTVRNLIAMLDRYGRPRGMSSGLVPLIKEVRRALDIGLYDAKQLVEVLVAREGYKRNLVTYTYLEDMYDPYLSHIDKDQASAEFDTVMQILTKEEGQQ